MVRSTEETRLSLAERLSALGRLEDARIALEHSVECDVYNRPVHRIKRFVCHQYRQAGLATSARTVRLSSRSVTSAMKNERGNSSPTSVLREHNFLELGGAT
jgi:hypothetical protein